MFILSGREESIDLIKIGEDNSFSIRNRLS